jgi:hypothetical protein
VAQQKGLNLERKHGTLLLHSLCTSVQVQSDRFPGAVLPDECGDLHGKAAESLLRGLVAPPGLALRLHILPQHAPHVSQLR